MTQDVFFRGGIANGNLFYKEDYQFYGESVINAYLLESQISRNPIIIVDEKTYDIISSSQGYDKFITSKNGRYYLAPFSYLEHSFNLDINESQIKAKDIKQECLQRIIEENK